MTSCWPARALPSLTDRMTAACSRQTRCKQSRAVDIAADFRGKYTTELGALRQIKTITGGATVGDAVAWCAAKRDMPEYEFPLMSKRGDLVVLEESGRLVAGVVHLNGRMIAVAGEKGIHTLPITAVKRGWKVLSDSILIRFITEHDPISWAIRHQTLSPVSHVEFGLEDGTWLGAHAVGGVQIRPADYAKPTFDDRYLIPVTPEQKTAIMDFAHAQIGKGYDFTAIEGILAHQDWRCPDRWFCSELVCAACEAAGLYLLRVSDNVNSVTPRDLYMSPLLYGRRVSQ